MRRSPKTLYITILSLYISLSLTACDDTGGAARDSSSAGEMIIGGALAGEMISGGEPAGEITGGGEPAGEVTGGGEPAGEMSNGGESTSGGEAGGVVSDWVDMECIDGQYIEALLNPTADISDLIASYQESDAIGFILSVLERRYPFAVGLVERGQMGNFGDCVDIFLRDRSSPQAIFTQLTTIVHECGHFADIAEGMFRSSVYLVSSEVTFSCTGGDAVGRQDGRTFARSLLNEDEYALEACRGGAECDFYRQVYLDGDPNNDEFEGGDQGYNSVVEETTQYINSLAVGYAFQDQYGQRSVSERDGILTFLWYVTRYLKMARESYPDAYAAIIEDDCWRELTLTLWGRAWLYLELTEGIPQLGINDVAIQARLTPELVAEIDRLRDRECRE